MGVLSLIFRARRFDLTFDLSSRTPALPPIQQSMSPSLLANDDDVTLTFHFGNGPQAPASTKKKIKVGAKRSRGDGGAAREDDTLIMRVAVKAIQERKATTILTKLEGRWSDGEKKRCTFDHFAFSRAAAEFACEYLRSGSLLVEAPLEAAEAASVIDFLGCDVQPSAFQFVDDDPFRKRRFRQHVTRNALADDAVKSISDEFLNSTVEKMSFVVATNPADGNDPMEGDQNPQLTRLWTHYERASIGDFFQAKQSSLFHHLVLPERVHPTWEGEPQGSKYIRDRIVAGLLEKGIQAKWNYTNFVLRFVGPYGDPDLMDSSSARRYAVHVCELDIDDEEDDDEEEEEEQEEDDKCNVT